MIINCYMYRWLLDPHAAMDDEWGTSGGTFRLTCKQWLHLDFVPRYFSPVMFGFSKEDNPYEVSTQDLVINRKRECGVVKAA